MPDKSVVIVEDADFSFRTSTQSVEDDVAKLENILDVSITFSQLRQVIHLCPSA